ncbi:hypothetical protein V8J82_22275 [Gymnodinialimonas sp. 2305UL16-5]|uniref:hypothetical protein n=1 Tax=Gymnodinialimonas mytili TaxID=3126503 RepID=UPI0030B5C552
MIKNLFESLYGLLCIGLPAWLGGLLADSVVARGYMDPVIAFAVLASSIALGVSMWRARP